MCASHHPVFRADWGMLKCRAAEGTYLLASEMPSMLHMKEEAMGDSRFPPLC